MKHMTISDQIRKALRDCGEPMTMNQLADANGWDSVSRAQASKNLYNMKQAGEIATSVAEEKVHYALNAGYVRGKHKNVTVAKSHSVGKSETARPQQLAVKPAVNATVENAAEPARMTRAGLLAAANKVVSHDRNATHGQPENSFAHIAAIWSGYLGVAVRPHDVAAMMAGLKLARIRSNPMNADNWIDLAGYAACGAEVSP